MRQPAAACVSSYLCTQQSHQQLQGLANLSIRLGVIVQDIGQLLNSTAPQGNTDLELVALGLLQVRVAIIQELAHLVLSLCDLHGDCVFHRYLVVTQPAHKTNCAQTVCSLACAEKLARVVTP